MSTKKEISNSAVGEAKISSKENKEVPEIEKGNNSKKNDGFKFTKKHGNDKPYIIGYIWTDSEFMNGLNPMIDVYPKKHGDDSENKIIFANNSYPNASIEEAVKSHPEYFNFELLGSVLQDFTDAFPKYPESVLETLNFNTHIEPVPFKHSVEGKGFWWLGNFLMERISLKNVYCKRITFRLPNNGFLYKHYLDVPLEIEKNEETLGERHGSKTWVEINNVAITTHFNFFVIFAENLIGKCKFKLYYNFMTDALDFKATNEKDKLLLDICFHKGYPENPYEYEF